MYGNFNWEIRQSLAKTSKLKIQSWNKGLLDSFLSRDVTEHDITCSPKIIKKIRDTPDCIESLSKLSFPILNLHPNVWEYIAKNQAPYHIKKTNNTLDTSIQRLITILQMMYAIDISYVKLMTQLNDELLQNIIKINACEVFVSNSQITLINANNYNWWHHIIEISSVGNVNSEHVLRSIQTSTLQFASFCTADGYYG